MPDPKKVQLQRYSDGLPSVMRKKTVYTSLAFYQKSDVLIQLTKVFCERFLPHYGDRTVDQMVQAARSVKQNLVEGFTDGEISLSVEIRLLGIARGSNRELLEDYQDYLKYHQMPEWALAGRSEQPGADHYRQRFDRMRLYCREHSHYEDYASYLYRWTDEEMCNVAICLCHMVDRAIARHLVNLDHEFVEQGGGHERMTAARLDRRGTQKEIIEQLQAHNAKLQAQIASLQRELDALKATKPEAAGKDGFSG